MKRKTVLLLVIVLLMVVTSTVSAQPDAPTARVRFWLTLLHNNDGESQVINAGAGLEDFGGAARFLTVVNNLRAEAPLAIPREPGVRRGVLMISSGDNFLAGPEFSVGLADGVPFYDTIAMELIDYDAVNLGNHDFDFGPDVLADFIAGYDNPPPYISANLDFSDEPALQAYVDAGVIRPNVVVSTGGVKVGIIGLETPTLPFVSSPRNVRVSADVAGAVQSAANRMNQRGIRHIILASHLQDIANEVALVGQLRHVDIVIAGGGDELLANADDLLIPGDEGAVAGPYPMMATDRTGRQVPIVTTSGSYRYVGQLVAGFDQNGNLVDIMEERSGPVRVAGGTCNGFVPCDDAVEPDPEMVERVVEPVEAGLAELAATVIATSEVDLDGTRASVRTKEANEGNLIADALKWQATDLADEYGVQVPDVAIQNGGGIRNDSIIPAGDITVLDTFDMLPFPNFVVVLEDLPRELFKEVLENAVACTQPTDAAGNPNCGTGRFAQVSGFSFEWSASGDPLILDLDLNVLQEGTRVRHVELDDGTVLVENGEVVAGDPITLATIDFSARGGDQYPTAGFPFTPVGATYQQALENYIVDGLGGLITAADYPLAGEGRIVPLP